MTKVTAEVVEPILGLNVASYALTPEEIASGEFSLPEMEAGDLYMAHMEAYDAAGAFPENLQLHVAVTYDTAEGEKTQEYTVQDQPEQGWGVFYWDDSEPATEGSYPGCFRFSTYESTIPVSLVVDEPEKVSTTPERIVISVSLSIGGRKIPAEACEITEEKQDDPMAELYETGAPPQQYYYARLLLRRPDWAPTHGTLEIAVTQQLAEDGSIWTSNRSVEY